jgi:hypothetical protein
VDGEWYCAVEYEEKGKQRQSKNGAAKAISEAVIFNKSYNPNV